MSEWPKNCTLPSILIDRPEDDELECESLVASTNVRNYMTEDKEEFQSFNDPAPPTNIYGPGRIG